MKNSEEKRRRRRRRGQDGGRDRGWDGRRDGDWDETRDGGGDGGGWTGWETQELESGVLVWRNLSTSSIEFQPIWMVVGSNTCEEAFLANCLSFTSSNIKPTCGSIVKEGCSFPTCFTMLLKCTL